MKNKRSILSVTAAAVLIACTVTACTVTSSKSLTFNVETGDSVKVELDTTSNLDLVMEEETFAVKEGETSILNGVFVTEEMRTGYVDAVRNEDAEIIKDTDEEFIWTIEDDYGTEYNRIVEIPDTELYALLGSMSDPETADKAFAALTIEVSEEE